MAKEPQVFGFGADDIKRIGSAVRIVERGPTMPTQPQMDSASVRQFPIFLGTAGSAAWTKQTSKTVTIYSGTPHTVTGLPPTTASAMTLTAFNLFANIAVKSVTTTTANTAVFTARWVAVSNNGWGWYCVAAECT